MDYRDRRHHAAARDGCTAITDDNTILLWDLIAHLGFEGMTWH